MNNSMTLTKICAAALLASSACTGALAQSAMAASGTRNGSTTMPAGMPPGSTSTKGDMGAAPARSGMSATDPQTGSTPGMPPGTSTDSTDGAMTPKGKGKGTGKHMKHSSMGASGASMSNP